MNNRQQDVTATQYLKYTNWQHANLAIIYSGDIRQPWKSVYGFSTTAARLAAGNPLILHCREDEVFRLMTRLNDLLGNSESLNLAHRWLTTLRQETRQKVLNLIEIGRRPIAAGEAPEVLVTAEQILTKRSTQPKVDRLASIFSPNHPDQELTGKVKMLTRLNILTLALEQAKDKGFHVIVLEKCRKPVRLVGNPEKRTGLIPIRYHLTLWSYLITRSDIGRSYVWN